MKSTKKLLESIYKESIDENNDTFLKNREDYKCTFNKINQDKINILNEIKTNTNYDEKLIDYLETYFCHCNEMMEIYRQSGFSDGFLSGIEVGRIVEK